MRESSWSFRTYSQAVLQAPVEPGMQKTAVRFAMPARARDCRVLMPMSAMDAARKASPKPSMVLSKRTATASGVLSRP